MSFLDKFRSKATKAVDDHSDKIQKGMNKAGELVDKRTGGKHHDKIEKAKGKANDALDKRNGRDGGTPPPPRP